MTDYAQAGRHDAHVVGQAVGAIGSSMAQLVSGARESAEQARHHGACSKSSWCSGYRRAAAATDAAVAVVAAAGGGALQLLGSGSAPLLTLGLLTAAVPVLWLCALALTHGYEKRFLGTTTEEYRSVVRSASWLFVLSAVASSVDQVKVAGQVGVATAPVLLVLGLGSRHLLRRRLGLRRLAGLDVERTVVIGNARSVELMVRQIQRAPSQGLQVVAACVSGLPTGGDVPTDVEGVPVFGYPEQAMSAVDLFDADIVAVSSDPDLCGKELRRLAWALEERQVDLVISPGLFEVAGPRLSIRPTAGMPLLHVERPVMSGARRVVKSVVDRVLTLTLALAAAPVLAAIALAVRLDSPGPVLFRQTRVGAGGEQFEMLKFRTMCLDAEARLADVLGAADAGNAVLFKMKDDPRVTRVGRVLRRFSLDELPQLINVLRGEMSLIGPRPPLPREVDAYEPDAVRRLHVQPGLTGLWQVSGRSDLSWDESLRLDLWYVDNWSLVLDLQIIFRTAKAVLRGSGAY